MSLMQERARVLVVDDSLVMRKILSDILSKDDGLEVVGAARNGKEALRLVRSLDPDVITMDIEMPEMDGMEALHRIMQYEPRPVVMLSAVGKHQADVTMKAMDAGAVDFIAKTSGSLSLDIETSSLEIVQKVKAASKVKVSKVQPRRPEVQRWRLPDPVDDEKLVMIGSSTGGPKVLPEVMSRLPENLPAALLLVQHMPEGFTKSFAEHLDAISALEVREATDGESIKAGVALVAKGNMHLVVEGRKIRLTNGPKVNFVRPAVDPLMKSGAYAYGRNSVGVILTGIGNDGTEGMQAVKQAGGRTIAQNEETCVVFGMPRAAIEAGAADKVVPVDRIASEVVAAVQT
ncbi:MAG TPA: chemotaxis response regulator protein-glutamate methylesterase [Methanomassiliicoccales archaeon]|jgi:two-component system chemotaxis response regulator CheB|nr:chemotaxis response regulator protein-glutamate methylesterase [Methanomassiliicoccales archaeon]